jgi:hypothetical protein
VAMVLDRLFLVIFSILNMGTFSIIISARIFFFKQFFPKSFSLLHPFLATLFDFREPLNVTVPSLFYIILLEWFNYSLFIFPFTARPLGQANLFTIHSE